jgi:hypothetical protein
VKIGEPHPVVVQDATEPKPWIELDAIAGEEQAEHEEIAAKVEADAAAKEQASAEECAQGWREALVVGGDMLCSMFPRARAVWSDDWMDREAAALARCFPEGAGKLFGNPWFGLAVVTAPTAIGVMRIVKEDIEAAEEKKRLDKLRKGAANAADVQALTPADGSMGSVKNEPAFGA